MVKIQQYQQRVDAPNISDLTPLPAESFVGTTEQQGALMSGITQKISKTVDTFYQKQKKVYDDIAAINADSQSRILFDNVLYGTDTNDKGAPVGILNRKGSLAQSSLKDFDTMSQEGYQKIYDSLQNEEQKQSFNEFFRKQYWTSRESVIKHDVAQAKVFRDESIASNLKQRDIQSGSIVNPKDLSSFIQDTQHMVTNYLQQEGTPKETIDVKNKDIAFSFTKNSVLNLLNQSSSNYKKADELINSVDPKNDMFSIEQRIALDKVTQGAKVENEQKKVYQETREFKLSNGEPDTVKTEKYVSQLKGFTPDEKDKIFSFVKAKGNEDVWQSKQRQEALDRDFQNTVLTGKNQGKTLSQLLPLSTTYGYDPVDINTKKKYIQDLFDITKTNAASNPFVEQQLYERILMGGQMAGGQYKPKPTRNEIDQAFQGGNLNPASWKRLRTELLQSDLKPDAEKKRALSSIIDSMVSKSTEPKDKLIEATIKNDAYAFCAQSNWDISTKDLTDHMTYVLKNLGQLVPQSALNKVNRWEVQRNFKTTKTALSANAYQGLMGDEVFQAVASYLKKTNNTAAITPDTIQNFTSKLGINPDELAQGTIYNEAILYLISKNMSVDPKNIETIVKAYSAGKKTW